ncbi:hypothetical protein [Noviherbaspirillum humi]|nr:hypothetical protein [Noviherbaspirillum humi]
MKGIDVIFVDKAGEVGSHAPRCVRDDGGGLGISASGGLRFSGGNRLLDALEPEPPVRLARRDQALYWV